MYMTSNKRENTTTDQNHVQLVTGVANSVLFWLNLIYRFRYSCS